MPHLWNRISLKYRIALTIFLLEAITFTLVLTIMPAGFREAAFTELATGEQAVLRVLGNVSYQALLSQDYGFLASQIELLQDDSHIEEVLVWDARRHRVVASTAPELIGQPVPPLTDGEWFYWRTLPVGSDREQLGEIAIRYSRRPLLVALERARTAGWGLAVMGMAGVALIGLLMGRMLTRRLTVLTGAAEALASNVQYVPTIFRGQDEIARLGRAFDRMIRRIRETMTALKESEERFQRFSRATFEAIFFHDQGIIRDVNENLCRLSGYSREELIGRNALELIVEEDRPVVMEHIRQGREAPYEVTGIRKDGIRVPLELRAKSFQYGEKKLRVVAVRDLTERKQIEAALRESDATTRALLAAIPDLIFRLSPEGKFVEYLSRSKEEVYAPPEVFLGRRIDEVMPEHIAQQALTYLRKTIETGIPQRFEYPLEIKGANRFYEARLVLTGKGDVLAIVRDITERETMQQALRRSEQELRLIVEASPVGIASVDAEARFIHVNPAFCEIVGYAPEALQQMTFEDITHPEDVEINRHCFEELVRGERQDYVLEKRYIRNDGEIIWGQLSVVAVRDEAGNFVQTVSVLQNITARKKAEQALQAEMEHNRLILKTTLDGYILADTTGKILEVNPAYCRMTGYTEAELQGMTIHQLEAMLDDRQIAERIREMVSEGGARFHTRHRCKDGRSIDLDVSISIMNTDTGPLVAAFVRDITEQRQAEEQQRKYLANLLALYEASVAFSLHLDAHKVGKKVVETLEHLLHWKRGSIWLLDEEQNRLELLAHSSMGLKGEALEKELKRVRNMVSAPGEGISGWVALHGEPVRLGDVTRDSRYICADPEIRSELCVPLKIGGRTIGSINVESEKLHAFTEDDERLLSILATQAAVAIENARLYASILSSERRYHILFQESPIPLWEEDFSEVKCYLDRLKKRRIKDFRRYFERHPQIVEECARRVKILEVNRAAIELHEADSKDALIAGLPGIFTPASYQAFKEELIAIIEGRTRLSLEASIKTLSGEERFIHLDWAVVPGSEKDLARVFVATIDITERKQAMRKMEETQEQLRSLTHHLQHVREEERSAIAREIHDELGQVLTAMKIDLSLIEQEIQGERADFQPAAVLEEIRALKQLIDSTIRRVRRIITELRPEVLEDLGLVEALKWQVKEFQKRTGLRCRFHSQVNRIELPPHSRIAVFRIVQEALTNVARHARAQRVRVNIRVKPPGYAISVQDDGKGISSEALTKKNTFGLLGIRERVALLGGRVNISGEPGKGTRVEIFIPQTQEFIPAEEQILVEKESP